MSLKLRIVAVALAVATIVLVPIGRSTAYARTVHSEHWFPSGDGTLLHADVFRPRHLPAEEPTPVVIDIGPYNNKGSVTVGGNPLRVAPQTLNPELALEGGLVDRGYTLVQVSLRGYGQSAGCTDLGGRGEQADVKAAVEWAASQPWSTGRVGMYGGSYDGWTQIMALATRPRGLAAVVIQAPLLSAYQGFFMNGVHYDGGWHLTAGVYAALDAEPNSAFDQPRGHEHWARGLAAAPSCVLPLLSETENPDRLRPFWQERELLHRAAGSDVPVLWSHGFLDANTKPDNFLPLWQTLSGPRRAWFGQYPHVRAPAKGRIGRADLLDEVVAWYDRFLKGTSGPVPSGVSVERGDGLWRDEPVWPPADAADTLLPLRHGSYRDSAGFDSTRQMIRRALPSRSPRRSASRTTRT